MANQQRLTTHTVSPEGRLDAKIIFIGEAPGKEEDLYGKPFIGSAGQLLDRCFKHVGILRSSVLLANCFFQRPPKNDISYYFSDKKNSYPTWEGQEHIDKLAKWLEELRTYQNGPNLIVALGAVPMKILTGKNRISKWRGSILPCTLVTGYKVYPTFHPSYVNRLLNETREALIGEKKKQQQNALPLFLSDLKRATEQAEFPEIRTPVRSWNVDPSYHEILDYLEGLSKAEEGSVAVDIETLSGPTGPILWCIGFSASPDFAFVIPFLRNMSFHWSEEKEAHILIAISKVFLNPKLKKIFQGGTYDLSILGRYYGLRVADNTYEDTMWCHQATYPYLPKALHVLTSLYTWEPYYKDEGKVNLGKRSSDLAEFQYNARDCCVTREIFPRVKQEAKEGGTWVGYKKMMARIPSLLVMILRGVKIDVASKKTLSAEFIHKASHSQNEISRLTGRYYNLDSPMQVKDLLYLKLRLPIQVNSKTGKETTDADALQKLKRLYPSQEVIGHILDYRKYSKLASTYTEMQLDTDGRVHTSYGFVSTWRLSSSESPFGSGGNLQNIPNKRTDEGVLVRKLFTSDEGKLMGARDLSQVEARIVAWESEDLAKIEAFLNPEVDVHWENSLDIFFKERIAYESQEMVYSPFANLEDKMFFFRHIGKTCVHAANYDMGPQMLHTILAREGIILEFKTCRDILNIYKGKNPFLGEWKRKIREEVKATRTLISSYGRKRQFMGRLNDNLYRSAYAFSPQNTAGEMVEDSIMRINKEVPKVEILLNVHDEVIFQFNPSDLNEIQKETKSRMEVPIEIKGRELLVPSEFKIGPSWGELKGVKDEP